jgi:hypothetical protein
MISEWMKIMLDEISRKRTEELQARIEEQRRREEHVEPEKRQSNDRRTAD